MKLHLVAGAAVSAIAGLFSAMSIASAADLSYPPVRAPIVGAIPASSWTGFYLGGGLGAAFGSLKGDSTYPNPFTGVLTTTAFADVSSSSFTANIYGGYNYQVAPQVVLGVEAEANWLNAAYGAGYNGGFGGNIATGDWQFGISARAGVLLNPTSMVYLKAGWAWTELSINDSTYFGGPLPAGVTATVNDGYRNGALLGAGIETLFAQNWLARLEAEYTVSGQDASITVPAFGTVDKLSADYLSARLGVAYKF